MDGEKKRVVVFTAAGGAGRDLEVFLQRLVESPEIDLVGVFVDQYSNPLRRVRFLVKRWGLFVFVASVFLKLVDGASLRRLWSKWHAIWVPKNEITFASLTEAGFPIRFVNNINSKSAAKVIQESAPDLGVILGGRILRDRVTTIPKMGTLNIHKHDATKYRGSPQIGYPERRAGESHLVVTIHFAISSVDQGDIVKTVEIPIERFDDDRSLSVKAAVFGMETYLEAIRAVLAGDFARTPQDASTGKTYISTPYLHRWQFWRPYRRLLNRSQICPRTSWTKRIMLATYRAVRFAACMTTLPWLVQRRKRDEQAGQAPIVIFYYHGVGNGGDNWMTLPLHRLDEDVSYLREHFEIIDIDEAVRRLRTGRNERTAAVLTFDDGYKSCFDNLKPYLDYYRVPATIFSCPLASRNGRHHAHDTEVGFHNASLMSANEIRMASSECVTIGSHGNYHEDMGQLNGVELEKAIVQSGLALQSMTGQIVRYFSFPFGKKNNMSTEALEAGLKQYDAMFSAYGGYNFPGGEHQFHFQRIANPASLESMVAIMSGMHRLQPFNVDQPAQYEVRRSSWPAAA